VAYGLPALAFSVPTIPVYVYLPSFYAEDLGLGLAVTGLILLAMRVFDLVSDPLVGVLSDRLVTRLGRRKPWIAIGAGAAGLALVMLFAPPQGVSAIYLAVWTGVLYLGWTMVAVPYSAWGAELSDDYDLRTRITAVREGLSVVGILMAAALPFGLGLMGWGQAAQLAGVAVATLLIGAPLVVIALARVPEARGPTRQTSFSLTEIGRSLSANAPFRRLLMAWFVNGLANGLPAVLLPLYLRHQLGADATATAGLIFVYFAAAVVLLPLWDRLSRTTSKNRAWVFAMTVAIAAFIWVPLIDPGNLVAFGVVCAITGATLGADLALPPAMQADVIDVDRATTGQERAGLYFSLWSMAAKLALAAAVGMAFPLLGWSGLEQGEDRGRVLLVALYAGVPVALKLAACALIWQYDLGRAKHAALREKIAQNHHPWENTQ